MVAGAARQSWPFDRAAIRTLRTNSVSVTLDRILLADAATVCLVAPCFDTGFEETPHAALIGQMDQDFSDNGVIRVGLFDRKGKMLANLSISWRLMDLKQGFHSDCRSPERVAVLFEKNAWSRMVILGTQPQGNFPFSNRTHDGIVPP